MEARRGTGESYNKKEKNRVSAPTMKSISIEEREGRLQQLFNDLQQDWDAYKQSYPKTSLSRRYSHSVCVVHSNTVEAIHLLHSSPGLLMAKLQQLSSTTNDLAAREIIQERREAIERGTFKGRRLFDPTPTDTESELGFLNNVMGQDCEVRRSLSFCSSDDEHYGNKASDPHSCYSSSSSSRPACLSHDFDGEQLAMVAEPEKRVDNGYVIRSGIENGSRYTAFFSVGIAIALLIFAVFMKSGTSIGGYEVIPVPT